MLFYGSICTMIVSGLVFRRKLRESWPLFFNKCLCEIKYNLLATREILSDWIYTRSNVNVAPLQTGRVAIVTGGSRGIGLMVVKKLLELDMEVIIACRTPAAGDKAILQIRESGVKTGQAKVYKLDNASLESVKQFAKQVKENYKQIHVLINNAGIMFCDYGETVDGFEQQWAVNYISHFLLTSLLLPLLKAGGLSGQCSRIVNVTSCAHLLGKIDFDNINNKDRFVTGYAYAQSKLAQEVFSKKLQDLLNEKKFNVQVYSVHPGVVLTELFSNTYVWKIRSILYRIFKTPEQGAVPIVYAAVNKAVEEHGGIYISNCRATRVHPDAFDPFIQEQLLQLSLQQVGLKNFFEYV